MRWADAGLVLHRGHQGESGLILSLFTAGHGRVRGLWPGGAKSRLRGMVEPGNAVNAIWTGNQPEQLGIWRIEPGKAYAALLLADPLRLACLEAALGLAESCLPEHVPHPASYAALASLLDRLAADQDYAVTHLDWELRLLAELGYGLDLGACAVTGQQDDLVYVSPRTGRAVSRAAGAGYKDRLLPLPALLGGADPDPGPMTAMLRGLALTGHFLERAGLFVPPTRTRYLDRLRALAPIKG